MLQLIASEKEKKDQLDIELFRDIALVHIKKKLIVFQENNSVRSAAFFTIVRSLFVLECNCFDSWATGAQMTIIVKFLSSFLWLLFFFVDNFTVGYLLCVWITQIFIIF